MLVCAAPRRTPFVGSCRCGHIACAEREQLAQTATLAPAMVTRLVAMSFLGMIEAIDQGAIGGVGLDNLFD
jgi:hypothetical protein